VGGDTASGASPETTAFWGDGRPRASSAHLERHPSRSGHAKSDDREALEKRRGLNTHRGFESLRDLVGFRVLDRVVVGDGSYVSFVERGWIQP
jgi:hypothetical protein